MDIKVKMKKESDNEHLISEMYLPNVFEGDTETSPILQCGVLEQIHNLAEHCAHPYDLNGHDDDDEHTSAEFFGFNDIDIEESKDNLIEDFRLKHENTTRYTHQTGSKHGSLGQDCSIKIENINFCRASELEYIQDTPPKIDDIADLSQNGNNSESKVDWEQIESKTEKSIDTDSLSLEQDGAKNAKISIEERICENFEIVKQEIIDETDIATPHTNHPDSEFIDTEILFFRGFETIGQNRIGILKLYKDFLSNELNAMNKSRTLNDYEDLGCIGQDEIRERTTFLRKLTKKDIQSIEQYRRRSRKKNEANLGNLEQVEIDGSTNLKGQGKYEESYTKIKQGNIVRITAKQKKEKNNSSKIIRQKYSRAKNRQKSKFEQNSNLKTFVCSLCNYKASSNASLEIHMRFHNGERPYKCKFCSKRFVTSSHLNRHMFSHSGIRNHVCVVCTRRFLLKSHLNEHMRKHTGARLFPCALCTRTFAHSSNLKKHMKTHVDFKDSKSETSSIIDREQFKCDICPKNYPYSSSLERHMTSHTGERKFQCPDCSKGFSQLSTMERHRWVHTKEKLYKCSFCTRSFTRSSSLIKHTTLHHN